MESNNLLGGWSAWSFAPSKEAINVFEESLGKTIGVKYKLVACASQLVNGTNYAFLCEAETATMPVSDYVVIAHVYQPLKGQPHITDIKPAGPKPNNMPGGWQNWQFAVTTRPQAIFNEATKSLLGVKYQALAVAQQVVAGMNYCFLCQATPVLPGASSSPALVWIYQPLQGAPHVTQINTIYQAATQAVEADVA